MAERFLSSKSRKTEQYGGAGPRYVLRRPAKSAAFKESHAVEERLNEALGNATEVAAESIAAERDQICDAVAEIAENQSGYAPQLRHLSLRAPHRNHPKDAVQPREIAWVGRV